MPTGKQSFGGRDEANQSHSLAAGGPRVREKWVPQAFLQHRALVASARLGGPGESRSSELVSEQGRGARVHAHRLVDICTYLHKLERVFEEKKVMK